MVGGSGCDIVPHCAPSGGAQNDHIPISFIQNLWKEGIFAAMFCLFNCLFPAWPMNKRPESDGYNPVPPVPSAPGVGMEMKAMSPGLPPRGASHPGYPSLPMLTPYVPGTGVVAAGTSRS